jgi:microcystin degradation protein MlrC
MARIAVGGFHHETNTFAPSRAGLEHFRNAASYPRMPEGAALPGAVAGLNLPIAGFIEAARAAGHEVVATIWAGTEPAGEVETAAFEAVAGRLEARLAAALPVDALYLCLHGAMVTQAHEDGEAELLRRCRAIVGAVPIVASLDYHANVSPEMVALADMLVAYRTYPHVDMAQTGRRAAAMLERLLAAPARPHKAFEQLAFLIPLVWQCTLSDPARRLFAELQRLETQTGVDLCFTPGFPLADVRACGPAVTGYGADAERALEAVRRFAGLVTAAEPDFAGRLFGADEAVERAMAGAGAGPVILADTQDNPGAGAASDTTWLLDALVRHDARDAAVALIRDEAAARAAHAGGVGAELDMGLGGASGEGGSVPVQGRWRVEALSDGVFAGEGRMNAGLTFALGPTALLCIGGVRVVV